MKAVLFLNMGGPDSLKAVRPFLFNLFSDREIIRLGPRFMQRPLAWLISGRRAPGSRANYEKIGGKSPLLEITRLQAQGVQQRLEAAGLKDVKCVPAMRYWHPRTPRIVDELAKNGVTGMLGLSLYPHYSRATSGSSINEFMACAKRSGIQADVIESYPDNPGYVRALASCIREGVEGLVASGEISDRDALDENSRFALVYSAHSLPRSFVQEGDPYVDHIRRTIDALEQITGIRGHLCYQSRSGPVKWLEPGTDTMLRQLVRERGKKNLLVVPISFVSDHIETLYEIDMLYGGMAREMGARLSRIPSLNDRDEFLDALAGMCIERLSQ